jgi:hypothetical protein
VGALDLRRIAGILPDSLGTYQVLAYVVETCAELELTQCASASARNLATYSGVDAACLDIFSFWSSTFLAVQSHFQVL